MRKYIDTYFDKSSQSGLRYSIHQFIYSRKMIQGLVRIPINLLLLCFGWEILKNKDLIKSRDFTLTKLYEEIVALLMKRYLGKFGEETINMTAETLANIQCKKEYGFLQKIAFTAMKLGEIIITSHNINQLQIQSDIRVDSLERITQKAGLLKPMGDNGRRFIDRDHYFIHLTFQEYFTARHLASCLESSDRYQVQEATDFIEQYKYSRFYKRVMSFTAGIVSRQSEKSRSRFWNIILNGAADLNLTTHLTLLIECLEQSEIQSLWHIDEILKYIGEMIESHLEQHDGKSDERPTWFLSSRVINSTKVPEYLIKVLQNADSTMHLKTYVIKALGTLGNSSSEIEKCLIGTLQSGDKICKCKAAEALGQLGSSSPVIVQSLIIALSDNEQDVRENVVYATRGVRTQFVSRNRRTNHSCT